MVKIMISMSQGKGISTLIIIINIIKKHIEEWQIVIVRIGTLRTKHIISQLEYLIALDYVKKSF